MNRVTITRDHNGLKLIFHVQLSKHRLEIYDVQINDCSIITLLDPEFMRSAYEEFRHELINQEA